VNLPISSVRHRVGSGAVCVVCCSRVSAFSPVSMLAFFDFRTVCGRNPFAFTSGGGPTHVLRRRRPLHVPAQVFERRIFLGSRKRSGFVSGTNENAAENVVAQLILLCAAGVTPDSSKVFSYRRAVLAFSCAGNEFGWNGSLCEANRKRCVAP